MPRTVAETPIITVQEQNETITLTLRTPFRAGTKAIVTLRFLGSLLGKFSGYYRGTYITELGEEKYFSTSQMQPCEARRAVPCFDEPALKATFAITLVAPKELTCLSNMDVKSVARYPSYPPSNRFKSGPF